MDLPTDDELRAAVDAFLERHQMADTRLGAEATGYPQFVSNLRSGRIPRLAVLRRVRDFMQAKDASLAVTEGDSKIEASA